jgi:hypothetical protein
MFDAAVDQGIARLLAVFVTPEQDRTEACVYISGTGAVTLASEAATLAKTVEKRFTEENENVKEVGSSHQRGQPYLQEVNNVSFRQMS